METIIQIVTALAAGALAATPEVAGQAVKDAYAGLKDLVVRKLGGKGEVEAAVKLLERKPESEERKTALAEELEAAGAGDDRDLGYAAQALLDLLKAHGLASGTSYQATVIGPGAVAQGPGATAAGQGGTAIGGNLPGGGPIGKDRDA
ncbi:MAG: hypothetical protein ACRDGJ_10345 [Candidatus Limnocylindria bacterium]